MTQELVLGVLLTALVGLVWVMTMSILADDRPSSKPQHHEPTSSHSEDPPEQGMELKHHTHAA